MVFGLCLVRMFGLMVANAPNSNKENTMINSVSLVPAMYVAVADAVWTIGMEITTKGLEPLL